MPRPRLTLQTGERVVNKDGRAQFEFVAKWNRLVASYTYQVAELPPSAERGDLAYATDLCVFDGAGTQETTGNGTGGLVTFNGTNWVVAGTNVVASA